MKAGEKNIRNELIQFLNENGWQRKLSKDERTIRFTKEGNGLDRAVHIFLSKSPTDADSTSEETYEALKVVRQFYGINFEEIRDKVKMFTEEEPKIGDTIFGRIPDNRVKNDSVDLSLAARVLAFLQAFLSETASAEVLSQGKTERVSRAVSREFLDRCRFGHTFRGSFGFSVECPIEPEKQLTLDLFEVRAPLGRNVALRINNGLSLLEKALIREDPTTLTKGEDALTVGMCNVLADFLDETELGHFDVDIRFSRYRGPAAVVQKGEHRLEFNAIPILREAAKLLVPEVEVSRGELIGIVIALRSTSFPARTEKDGLGKVTVRVPSEYGSLDVSIMLDGQHYADAIRAHEHGLFVRVIGNIERKYAGKLSVLKVIDFQLA